MPTPFVLLSPSACAVQNNLLCMKQILARYKISRNAFLTLLKISLLLNYNNFHILVLFSVLTYESITFFKYIIFYLREVLWSENCFDNYANVQKKGNRPQLLYITLGFAVLICSLTCCVPCEPCFLWDKAWKQPHYMNNSSDYDVSGNLKCCLRFFQVITSLEFCLPAWTLNRLKIHFVSYTMIEWPRMEGTSKVIWF